MIMMTPDQVKRTSGMMKAAGVTMYMNSAEYLGDPLDDPPEMMHDHPSGDPTPSQADIQMTKAIVEIAKPLGIAVHDHIIVGKNGHASLRGMKLI